MQLRFIDEHNDRGHLLWAEEPVGLALRGETQQAALSKLPAELTAYRRWLGLPPGGLRRTGATAPVPSQCRVPRQL